MTEIFSSSIKIEDVKYVELADAWELVPLEEITGSRFYSDKHEKLRELYEKIDKLELVNVWVKQRLQAQAESYVGICRTAQLTEDGEIVVQVECVRKAADE